MRKVLLCIVVALIAVISSGCSIKSFLGSKDIELQTPPANVMKAVEETCDSLGYDIAQKSTSSVACRYQNSGLVQWLFLISKQADITVSFMTEKSLRMDVSVIGNMGFGTQGKANEIIAEFETLLDKKLSTVKN